MYAKPTISPTLASRNSSLPTPWPSISRPPQPQRVRVSSKSSLPTISTPRSVRHERIRFNDYGFGTFISGPSKTADIEQSLVYGAQAARGLTVFLTE